MKKSAENNIHNLTDGLLPELTRVIFLADNYAAALTKTLHLLSEMIKADYAECRTKAAEETTWHLACSYQPEQVRERNKSPKNLNGDHDFFKPSLEVVDEVWLTDISGTKDPLLPESLRNVPLFALCIHIAFGNGRNDLFRLLLKKTLVYKSFKATSMSCFRN